MHIEYQHDDNANNESRLGNIHCLTRLPVQTVMERAIGRDVFSDTKLKMTHEGNIMKKILMLTAALGVGFLAIGSASAGTVSYSGDTAGTPDGFFANPNGVCDPCAYDVQEFNVDADGLYTIDAFYPGDTDADANMDGYLLLYLDSFDSLSPGDSIALDDDGPGGSNTSQIANVALTAGNSYFLVTTAFDDVPTSFGQPSGAFENTISGLGNISLGGATVVPEPGLLWLLGAALIGLGVTRRRKS